MNTTQLECFLAVASYLNFSRAAEQLRITQPAVSYQINTLEDELGAKLFERTSKAVRLTRTGHLFLQYASDILKLTGLSKARIRESQETAPQLLGIGCRNFWELRFLEPLLEQLRLAAPKVQPQLRLIPFASLENLLEDGDIQVLFTLEDTPPAKAVYRAFCRCPLVCVCGMHHPLADRTSVTSEELQHAGPIAACPPQFYSPALFPFQSRLTAGRGPDGMCFCDNLEIAFTMTQAGYCFLVTPDLAPARLPGLRYLPITDLPALSFGAFYRSSKQDPALRRFLQLVEAALAPS